MRRQPLVLPCIPLVLSMSVLSLVSARDAAAQAAPTPAETQMMPAPPVGAPGAVPEQPMPPMPPMPPMDAMPMAPMPPPPMVEALPPPPPPPPAPKATVGAKFSTDIYGFVEFDSILDSTQSFNEIAGNNIIAKKGTFAGDHSRFTYSGRNTRLGFKFKGPDSDTVRTSAVLEADFLGNQPTGISDAALLTSPTLRVRHAMLKIETPFVDVMAGQYWQLFGWQSYFFPNSVEIMGLPGQVFGRSPQLRLSHPFKTDAVTIEVAIASSRSPQRDGGIPDTQGGIRLLVNDWKGLHTANSTGTAVDSLGIGVSGVFRRFRVNEFAGPVASKATNSKSAGGISVDALLPIIPATMDSRGNALTLTGSYVRGTGIADLFTGLTGGVKYPGLSDATMTYTPNIDGGLVTYNPGGDLHTIDWQAFMIGAQYYLPPSGCVWISGNYTQMNSPNMHLYATTPATAAAAFKQSQFADGNLFWDVNKSVRLGGEFAWFKQKFVDGSTSKDLRGQFSAFYLF